MQHKKILGRKLPEALKLSIAKKMENNLFSKVILHKKSLIISFDCIGFQISFLVGLHSIGEIRTLFAAEVDYKCFKGLFYFKYKFT
jgi:hypothetical protein